MIIEAIGLPQTFRSAVEEVAFTGRVVYIGYAKEPVAYETKLVRAEGNRHSHLAGVAFDAAVWELWPYLSCGAGVALVDESTRTSPDLLRQWICGQNITLSFVPTTLAEPMLGAEWPAKTKLRYLFTGADTLHHRLSRSLPFPVVNNYGPTECTVVATSAIIPSEPESGGLDRN